MEIANCRLRLNKVGSDIPLNDITPAEAMLLHILHGVHNGGLTFGEEFKKIEIIGSAMVDTGKTKTVVVAEATEAVYETKIIEPAVPQKGTIPAKAAVTEKVLVTPAIEEVTSEQKVLRDRTDVEELNRLRVKYGTAKNKENKSIIDSIWPDRFNPKLPQKFSELKWQEIGSAGIEVAPVNYATGGLATAVLPSK